MSKALNHALAWEMNDDILNSLQVESVVSIPGSSRLHVTLSAQPGTVPADLQEILQQLKRCTGKHRAEVAAMVHRRRVPELSFEVHPGKEGSL